MAALAATTTANFVGGRMSDPNEARAAEYCSICGQPAAKAWHGERTFAVCSFCATEWLPAMIADAITLPGAHSSDSAFKAHHQIDLRFWRALAIRLLGERDKR
jgi:hypothetical protein